MVLPFPDEVPHPWRRHQHLARHDTPLAVVGGDERLGDDALQGVCELRADLVLLVRREDVYDPVDGLRGILGVQRAEDEMPSLRRSHSERDGLEVAHLAYEYHVGVLPQDMLESLGEAPCTPDRARRSRAAPLRRRRALASFPSLKSLRG